LRRCSAEAAKANQSFTSVIGLEEVQRICDRATVLRHGKVVGHCNPRDETPASLARMMVGSSVHEVTREAPNISEWAPLIEIKGLSQPAKTPFAMPLKDICLTVKGGELVGIAGVAGNGQGEFFEAVSGEALQQRRIHRAHPRRRRRAHLGISGRRLLGAGFVPEERLGHGAVPGMKLSQNMLLARIQV
jgi:ABC-type uncharacterized transport system ATPase subunit